MPIKQIINFFQFLRKFRNEKINIQDIKYLPRWVIFYIDVIIVTLSILLNYALLFSLNADLETVLSINLKIFIYIVSNALFFIIFRTYSGLVRHSTYVDVIKLFLAVGSSHFFILIVDNIQYIFTGQRVFKTTTIVFALLLSFSNLLLFRIAIRIIFDKLSPKQMDTKKLKTLVIGTNPNSISLVQSILEGVSTPFEVVGFVTNDESIRGKRIFDLRIYKYNRPLPILYRFLRIQAVIIGDNSFSKAEKTKIITECLENDLKVYKAPRFLETDSIDDFQHKIKRINIEELLQREAILLDNAHFSDIIYNKVIMVTGGAGSIGTEIVLQLANYNPKSIIIVDQAETPLHHLELELSNKFQFIDFKFIIADVRDALEMENVFKNFHPNYIYHAAAYKHVPMMEKNRSQAILANVMGTKIVADLAVKYKVCKFIFISTDKAVNPTNIMGASKRIAEIYIQSLHYKNENKPENTKFITTRFGNVLGSNGSVVELFKKQIQSGGPITLTHKEVTRFFMTIPEACQLVLEAAAMGSGGEIFLFDMGEPIKIYDLAKNMILLSGLKPNIDIELKFVGLRPGEKLYEELITDAAIAQPTHHQKIMISKETNANFDENTKKIEKLIEVVRTSDSKKTLELIRDLVPEYFIPNYQNDSV
jgi:FlaA1/EpsC-like NDP-sugar epimerase